MKKVKISKIIISIIMFVLIISVSTNVFADEPQLDFGNLVENTTNENVPDLSNTIDTSKNDNANINTNTNINTNINTNTNTNTSTYEETDIPYAGPVEDALMITAFIIFGIIGIYTFKKLSDYSNL